MKLTEEELAAYLEYKAPVTDLTKEKISLLVDLLETYKNSGRYGLNDSNYNKVALNVIEDYASKLADPKMEVVNLSEVLYKQILDLY